jgi:8-oxo-dGTP diphosphatase
MTNAYDMLLIGANVFLIRDNKVFLIRRFNTGFGDGLYSVPAGHVDVGELIPDAAAREAMEEAGVTVDPASLQYAHIVHMRILNQSRPNRMQCFFVAHTWEGEPSNVEPEKCDHADWFPIDALPENMVGYTRQAIMEYKKGNPFSHFDE